MKKKNLQLIQITLSVIVIFIASWYIYTEIVGMTKTYTIALEEPYGFSSGRPAFPVEIDGENYLFLFDTGSTVSAIDSVLAHKLNISISSKTVSSVMIYPTLNNVKEYFTEKIHFKIGERGFHHPLSVSNHTIKSLGYDGIIGMDIMSQFYWHFDIKHKIIYFSKKEIYPEKNKAVSQLEFVYQRYGNVPNMVFVLNDTLITYALFDTGAHWDVLVDKDLPKKNVDLLINGRMEDDSLINYFIDNIKRRPEFFTKDISNISNSLDSVYLGKSNP